MSALVPLANVTLTSNATTITFSSISQSYRDLLFVFNLKSTLAPEAVSFRVNGLTSFYGYNLWDGSGTTINANTTYNTSSSALDANYATSSTSIASSGSLYMADYSATDRRKTSFIKNSNERGNQLVLNGSRTPATAAVTSIVFSVPNFQFATGSSIALYGVTA
jgi:hypothetical protein